MYKNNIFCQNSIRVILMTNKEIKKLSKQYIKNRRGKALLIGLFSLLTFGFFSILPSISVFAIKIFNLKESLSEKIVFLMIFIFIMLLFTFWALSAYSSFSLGTKAWYSAKMSKNQLCGKKLLFWFRPKYSFKALRFNAALFFAKLLWSIALLLPATSVFACIIILAYSGGIELYLFTSLISGGIILLIAGLIFRFITIQRYFLAPYLIASNPKLGAIQALKQSKNLTDGHISDIIQFKLSFTPWFLSCLLIFPVFIFYPYYKQSCSVIAKSICL